jgi:pimeloyl-ACP methyl ester carboxylesterase
MATYVLVHGGWAGGWQFKLVEPYLRHEGHNVYRPTLTGLGERVHLASPNLDLNTHISDVTNVFKYEELEDVILLGYSYSGLIVTGVAEKIPHLIKHLVYLDAFVPADGQSLAVILGKEVMQFLLQAADTYGDGWRVPPNPNEIHLRTDLPVKPGLQPLSLTNPQAARIPKSFIFCKRDAEQMDPILAPIIAAAAKAKTDPAWHYFEVDAFHGNAWQTHPKQLSEILLRLA